MAAVIVLHISQNWLVSRVNARLRNKYLTSVQVFPFSRENRWDRKRIRSLAKESLGTVPIAYGGRARISTRFSSAICCYL
jgi:hypothetical protein